MDRVVSLGAMTGLPSIVERIYRSTVLLLVVVLEKLPMMAVAGKSSLPVDGGERWHHSSLCAWAKIFFPVLVHVQALEDDLNTQVYLYRRLVGLESCCPSHQSFSFLPQKHYGFLCLETFLPGPFSAVGCAPLSRLEEALHFKISKTSARLIK